MDALKVMILGVNQYSFEDEKTKREVSGTTVHYVQLTPANEEDKVGFFPAKATLPYEDFYQFKGAEFPVTGDARITFDLSNKRNPIKVLGFSLRDSIIVE